MNKLTRGLMSGASFAALSLGSAQVAEAANITITTPTPSVSVAATQVYSYISVTTGGDVAGDVTNDGVVGLHHAAISVNGTGIVGGNVVNNNLVLGSYTGIGVTNTADIAGNIDNNGTIVVERNGVTAGNNVVGILDLGGLKGSVFNTGTDASIVVAGAGASGEFIGVEQHNTHAELTNSAILLVAGHAGGADYIGVSQVVTAAASAAAIVTNDATGQIKVNVATASHEASADYGIYQYVDGTAGAASANISNDGLIEVAANGVNAFAALTAKATGYVDYGIEQEVYGVKSTADASLTNSSTGTIDILAGANVVGAVAASAIATVNVGVSQYGDEGDTVSASIDNAGIIDITAQANATGVTGKGYAAASVDYGIYQYVESTDTFVSSSALLTNESGATLSIEAVANAAAGGAANASAYATIDYGVYQEAYYGDASASVSNSGALNIESLASATGAKKVYADATVETGIYQYASGDGLGNASAAITNASTGALTIEANAHAVGAAGATHVSAYAYIDDDYGIYQSAETGAVTTTATIANSGALSIEAIAAATGPLHDYAEGYIYYGIYQDAYGSLVAGASANDSITNASTGTLNILAQANAVGLTGATHVDASAEIAEYGIYQYAYHAETAGVSIDNAGTLSVEALAHADPGTDAYAEGYVDYGIYQYAYVSGAKLSAADTLTNESGGTLNVIAQATATGGKTADAYAYNEYPVYQEAYDGAVTSVSLTNNGTMNLEALAHAHATGTAGDAYAEAYIYEGIYQEAGATAGGASASVTLSNTGDLSIESIAGAVGAKTAEAYAYIDDDTGIYQEAYDGTAASVSLTNSSTGTLSIEAIASASGNKYNYAEGEIYYGIYQYADASTLAGATSNASLTNAGTLNIVAQAHAVGLVGATEAEAYAYIDEYGVYQEAYHAETDAVALDNAGTLNVEALAHADPAVYAYADGYVDYGIYQYADATGAKLSAAAALTNESGGTLNLIAQASATGAKTADAYAYNYYPIEQYAYDANALTASLTNNGTMNLSAIAHAHATGLTGTAYAEAYLDEGIYQYVDGSSVTGTTGLTSLNNAGTLTIAAAATATAVGDAEAEAYNYYPIYQAAENQASDSVTLDNSGTINLLVNAKAISAAGSAYAYANMDTGISQYADAIATPASSASVLLTNESSGVINIGVHAVANGATEAKAYGYLSDFGIWQSADDAGTTTATLNNSGTININVSALADPNTGLAFANAHIGKTTGYSALAVQGAGVHPFASALGSGAAIFQEAYATGSELVASVALTNSGHITIDASATATGGASARAYGLIGVGISQIAEDAAAASATLTNSGSIAINANANANAGTSAFASAAVHTGIYQYVTGNAAVGSNATAALVNTSSGVISINANAHAVGTTAEAIASVTQGIFQEATNATTNTVSISNSGSITVGAKAVATATSSAYAYAFAQGAHQYLPNGGAESFTNSGTFTVTANATATGSTARAYAYATGLYAELDNGATVAMSNASSGVITVSAIAHGTAGTASAYGMLADNHTVGGTLAGTIENDGTLNVLASAPGAAYALGIGVRADEFTGTITNKGTIHVAAIGLAATATGIAVTSYNTPTHTGVGTVVNDGGTMWVGVSSDGITFFRGDAMYLRNAPNTINVDLKGNGDIYGNIDLAAGDTVTVSGGTTKFDGIVNDNLALVGTVAISADGTLELANGAGLHNAAEAPAQVYADTYTQTGTLELEVTPTPVAVAPTALTTAGFVKATNVTLSGGVLVAPDPGLYSNTTVYQTIFSATPISGQWSSVTTTTGTPLLTVSASYPTAFEADVVLTRVAFDAVAGLTPNEEAVGDGLENAYSTSLSGASQLLYEGLFGVNAAQYPAVLDMLSGEEAGEVEQLNVDAADMLTKGVTDHLGFAHVASTMSASNVAPVKPNLAMGGTSPITVWGGFYGMWDNTAHTISGPGYTASNVGMIAGVDTAVDPDIKVGLAFNYNFNGSARFQPYGKPVGNHANYEGFQIGGYGRYDNPNDNWYLQALISYGNYDNKTARFISLPAPFGSGVVDGKFNSDVFAVYGEGGVNLDAGGGINLTPYAALAYTDASSGAYTETGMPGANLAVSDASSTSTSLFLGVKLDFSSLVGDASLTPTLKAAWRHNFDDNTWNVNASFDGLVGSGFSVNGRALSHDSGVFGAGLGYAIDGNVSAMLDYEGDVSSDRVTQSVMGRIKIELGEEAAPPPPPPPPAPPPAPPPPPPPPVKTFIVFFDFDKSDLTDQAQQVVAQAVTAAKAGGFVKVLVTGHTDTVGSDTYNQALSIRRAQTVKDEMVHEGLDGGGIAIEGKSFHDPLVPTGPGVREPQNRRAVIDLGG